MHHKWQNIGLVAPGGVVLKAVADHQDNPWLASPAGLFHREDRGWRAYSRGIPFWRVNALAAAGRNLWLAGQPGGIMRSTNGGRSWQRCWLDQTDAPIFCLALSPNYSRDRTLLAGTDGDGILRSTDGGRHWELCNFGLRDFVVLDLLTAPAVGRYEYAFAITENGVYQSPNSGRAWRRVDSDRAGLEPSALAVSPTFADDQTVYLGNQVGDLLRSTDAGRQWQVVAEELGPVNALTFTGQGALLVGTAAGIARLDEQELATMTHGDFEVTALPSPVLTLNQVGRTVYAGLADGLFFSEDDGRRWQADDALAARRFVWYLTPSVGAWLAGGPEEGAWISEDGGHSWRSVWQELPLLALAATPERIWVSAPEGMAQSADSGQSWDEIDGLDEPVTALTVAGETLWAGTPSGQLWRRPVEEWLAVSPPAADSQLLGLLSSGTALFAAYWSPEARTVDLWCSDDEGQSWQRWFSQPGAPVLPQVAFADESGRGALVGLGQALYRETAGGWQRLELPGKPGAVTALLSDEGDTLAAFGDLLMSSSNGSNWLEDQDVCAGESIVALRRIARPAGGDQILAATATGRLFVGEQED